MSNENLAREIFSYALQSVLPQNFMNNQCRLKGNVFSVDGAEYNLDNYKNIYLFGSGKAAYTMALEMEKILPDRFYKGFIVSPYNDGELHNIEVKISSHPILTQESVDAAKALQKMMQECDEDDLYIYLLSGGSSALVEIPIEPVTLEDMQIATQLLLQNTLDIHEINIVRKHLSSIKGGKLAQGCKASGVVLVVSDIIDNAIDAIGSAPLYADSSSYKDMQNIFNKYKLTTQMPKSIQEVLAKGISGEVEESPFEPLSRVKHHIIASNPHAVTAAASFAKQKGLSVKIVAEAMQGEVVEMTRKMLDIIESSDEQCIIFGGECTVNLTVQGKGGRNQHASLLMLEQICKHKLHLTFLSASTDGIDGNSDAAGAVVSEQSCKKAEDLYLDLKRYIANFNSYNFLKQTQGLIFTGPSGTNVIDIAIILKQ